MVSNILKIVALISNCLPILHISEDSEFGSINNLNKIRFSIISISWGKNKLYLLSFLKDSSSSKWKFQKYKRLNFYEACKKEDQVQIDTKTASYKQTISYLSDENINIQIDFLKEKYNQNENIKSTLYNKINNYAAINLAHISFIGYLLTEVWKIENYSVFILFFIICILSFFYTLNYSLFIIFGLSLKSFVRSTFKDLKENPVTKELAGCYYTDWYSSKNEANIISSIVSNIEEYCIRGLISSILLWIFLFINTNLQNKITHSASGYINESLIINETNRTFNKIFPNRLIYTNNIDNQLIALQENNTSIIKKQNIKSDERKQLSHTRRHQKKKKINVKIIDNNTVLIKYKD